MQQHDRLVNLAAKKILIPNGMFRRGASRTWLYDCGYFLIFAAFEASGWSKGSYMGVGVNFLCDKSEALNNVLCYDYGGRIKDFCQYRGDDAAFKRGMELYAEAALQKVEEYRKFKNMDYAKRHMRQKISGTPDGRLFGEVYDFAMLCFLAGDYEKGRRNFEKFLYLLKENTYAGSVHIKWHAEFYSHCTDAIMPYLTTGKSAQKLVVEMINRRRAFFRSKPSFKKMNEKDFFVD